jgi:phosphatidylglycerophosphate synthase
MITGNYRSALTLPNALSVSRVAVAVAIIVLLYRLTPGRYFITCATILWALGSDVADGWLARRQNTVTELGYVLDTVGDRAVHLALLLVFAARYSIHPLAVWLLVFRDIAIYAVRVLSRNWFRKSLAARWTSKLNAAALRMWLGLFFIRDGISIVRKQDTFSGSTFEALQMSALVLTLCLSYYSLISSVAWLTDPDRIN